MQKNFMIKHWKNSKTNSRIRGRCLLDYDYIRNRYKLIGIDLSRQKELDDDLKVIQQIEFIWQWKNENGINADGAGSY